jgi:hypothetical protein
MGVIGAGCSLVNLTDVSALCIEGRIGLWGQPVTDAMRLEVGLFFKKRPTERCEMFGTRPRRIASSAISRWLQWLIGRSLSDGFSQVIAMTAQICSGVYVAGAPDRRCIGQPLGHRLSFGSLSPPPAPIPHRLWPHIEFAGALAHTNTVGCMQDYAGAQGQLLRRQVGSDQLFQRFQLLGKNSHRVG